MKRIIIILSSLLVVLVFGQAPYKVGSEIRLSPRLLNYQGYLTDTLFNPINDSLDITFRICDAASAGSIIWYETQFEVPVLKGIFHVMLGSVTPLPDSVFTKGAGRWLEIRISSQSLAPRTQIVSAPYAYTSTYADTAQYSLSAAADNDWTRSGGKVYTSNLTDTVGIGTASPSFRLDVNGRVGIRDSLNMNNNSINAVQNLNFSQTLGNGIRFYGLPSYSINFGTNSEYWYGPVNGYSIKMNMANAAGYGWVWGAWGSAPVAAIGVNGNMQLAGNLCVMDSVGIGTSSPARELDINGSMRLAGALYDRNNEPGASGQVLSTTVTGVDWIDKGAIDNDWAYLVSDVADTTLQMGGRWGLARPGSALYGNADSTHVNFGVACTTGASGQNYKYAAVGGGLYNASVNSYATVGGGTGNKASGAQATVGGGISNIASDTRTTVAGGGVNTASVLEATVGGGANNTAGGIHATVGGGYYNHAAAFNATVGGGYCDTASGYASGVFAGNNNLAGDAAVDTGAAVCGGARNHVTAKFGFVGGGVDNAAANLYAVVGGGSSDSATGISSFVGGGSDNIASGRTSSVMAGGMNTSSAVSTTVGGGWNNSATTDGATVVGGSGNTASGYGSFIGGGGDPNSSPTGSTASGGFSAVVGGNRNACAADYSFVGAGLYDTVHAVYGTAVSGYSNLAGDSTVDTAAVVVGGWNNTAYGKYSFVGGGYQNTANGRYATVAGGNANTANGTYHTFIGGGSNNSTGFDYACVTGGLYNNASSQATAIGGGAYNGASSDYATVAGGTGNTASGAQSTIGGGTNNIASFPNATVSGGYYNVALNNGATVAGGNRDSSMANYSFTVGNNSTVLATYSNSAAFNGQTATASGETRVGVLSKASGTFTIDHPLDPENKILNHYFVESPEMSNLYSGSVILDAGGRADIDLPDYFDALNKNPRVQLTGVGSSDVYVKEDFHGDRFAIGGKPGMKVYYTVVADRKDPSAEITRILMPVEQVKEGGLAGRSLDDEFLVVTMEQLERMGKADGFKFRHASEQKRYEEMEKMIQESGVKK